jgi:hypothetical protein
LLVIGELAIGADLEAEELGGGLDGSRRREGRRSSRERYYRRDENDEIRIR